MKAGGVELRFFLGWLRGRRGEDYFEIDDVHGGQVIGFKMDEFVDDSLKAWVDECDKMEKLVNNEAGGK